MNQDCVLVHAYFGASIPRYVRRNLKLQRKSFPEKRIVLITNADKKYRLLKRLKIEISMLDLYTEQDEFFSKSLERDSNFRNDFWYLSLIRLIAVCNWQQQNKVPVLHIESDVIIFPNFPFSKFESLEEEIAFPKSKPELGVASVLYIRSAETANKVIDFSRQCISENPNLNDMVLLGKISKREEKFKVAILPTISSNVISEIEFSDIPEEHLLQISSMSHHFEGCFDATAFGQYFLGDDPRNYKGRKRLFKNPYYVDLNLSNFRIKLNGNQMIASNSRKSFQLFCLHIHSKDIRVFSFAFMRLLLIARRIQADFGVKSVVTHHVLRYWLNPIKHRIKFGLKKFVNRHE